MYPGVKYRRYSAAKNSSLPAQNVKRTGYKKKVRAFEIERALRGVGGGSLIPRPSSPIRRKKDGLHLAQLLWEGLLCDFDTLLYYSGDPRKRSENQCPNLGVYASGTTLSGGTDGQEILDCRR